MERRTLNLVLAGTGLATLAAYLVFLRRMDARSVAFNDELRSIAERVEGA